MSGMKAKAAAIEAPQPQDDDEPRPYLVAKGHIFQSGAGNVHGGSSVYLRLGEARLQAVLGAIVAPTALLEEPAVRRSAAEDALARLERDRDAHGWALAEWVGDPRRAAVYARVLAVLEEEDGNGVNR